MSDLPVLVDLHENVFFDEEREEVVILDRRELPRKVTHYRCRTYEEVARAIEKMVTQSLGVSPAAGYAIALAAYEVRDEDNKKKINYIKKSVERIKNTRPTQYSLHHLVDEMKDLADEKIKNKENVFEALRNKAYDWTEYLMSISRKIGKYASDIITNEDTILTHCYGGPSIYFTGHYSREKGKKVDFYVTETRPYLQGARLTSFALTRGDFDVTLITDGMPAHCIRKNKINKFITGADRISMDGGVTNKIGTYQIALAANKYDVPFYAYSCAGPDRGTPRWEEVEIEERDPEEIFKCRDQRIAPKGINGYYPAFDCTPPDLVEGIVTKKGIFKPNEVQKYFEE